MINNAIGKIAIPILIVFFAISCGNASKHKPDPNVKPKYVIEQSTFNSNGYLAICNHDTLSAMITKAHETCPLNQLYAPIKDSQAIIIKYADERRRTYSMSDIGQNLCIIFLNSNKMTIHTSMQQAYSTQQFNSYEYAKYVVLITPTAFTMHEISEGQVQFSFDE